MPRVEDRDEFIIDLSDDESDSEEAGPARLKAWLQAGTRGARPIAGNKRVDSSSSVSSYNSNKSSASSSPVQSPSSETGAASGLITAAHLHDTEKKAFVEAWATATPFFNPKSVEFGPESVVSGSDAVMVATR
ncbi:hypothetical protein BKA70DRAFT_1558083 [Coprinopsis sp. MPI-PUGE-AT-0042]|nr:hypothetical protein BKA70DRAFT_1558083 [Coprinopsis sp. MPI-PUGE-AT-0042]